MFWQLKLFGRQLHWAAVEHSVSVKLFYSQGSYQQQWKGTQPSVGSSRGQELVGDTVMSWHHWGRGCAEQRSFLIVVAPLWKNLKFLSNPIPLPSLIVSFFFNQLAIHFPNKRQFKNWKHFKGKFLNDLILYEAFQGKRVHCAVSAPHFPSCPSFHTEFCPVAIVWALNHH